MMTLMDTYIYVDGESEDEGSDGDDGNGNDSGATSGDDSEDGGDGQDGDNGADGVFQSILGIHVAHETWQTKVQ